jgi:hypothetical protein
MDYDFYKRTFQEIIKDIPRKQFEGCRLGIISS